MSTMEILAKILYVQITIRLEITAPITFIET